MQPLPKIIAVVGTTASGKSALALQLAKAFNGEVVSVDSRQIYKDMDIGTNKEPGKEVVVQRNDVPHVKLPSDCPVSLADVLSNLYEVEGVVHYMIGVVRPDQTLTLAHFKILAEGIIDDILSRGKLPILVGGTGLYVTAILENWQVPTAVPDPKLRAELQDLPAADLAKRLKQLDPLAYDAVDRNNPRRLVRAIEMAMQGQGHGRLKRGEPRYDALYLAPVFEKEVVYKRIDDRVDRMVTDGLVQEVKAVGEKYGFDCVAMTGHAYQQIGWYLQGKISLQEALDLSKKVTRAYAKRQITWWKKFGDVQWMKDAQQAEIVTRSFLRNP